MIEEVIQKVRMVQNQHTSCSVKLTFTLTYFQIFCRFEIATLSDLSMH